MAGKRNVSYPIVAALLVLLLTAGFIVPNGLLGGQEERENTVVTETPSGVTSGAVETVAATAASTPQAAEEEPNYTLTILHTNDVHAHHAPNGDGDGGAARAASVISQVRSEAANTLLLSAGDTFMGTLFYVMHHGIDSAELMNLVQYDTMTIGNHEFDDGDGNLALFIDALNFPVTAANVDFEKSTALKGKTTPYVVIEEGGEKIGVIGLANPETPTLSRPGSDLVFLPDSAQVVQKYVKELTGQDVNKIIVLSHLGYGNDLKLAQAVSGVDVIVGAHSHTLLANYDTRADDFYPVEVENSEGKTVLVVQSGENLEYLGRLDVEFDPAGELVDWGGDSIFLSRYITPDPQVQKKVDDLFAATKVLTDKVVGKSSVHLEGDRKVCRVQECNLGNLITDAMRAETGVQVALENGGGIRASIEQGDVTLGDVLNVLPFGNLVSTFKLSGADLLAALENGASKMEEVDGRFLQVSGLRYEVDSSKPAGSRIVKVEVLDAQGEYQPLDEKAMYSVATNDFMRGGGDGYEMLAEKAVDAYDFGSPLDQVLANYITAHTPLDIGVEGRIVID